MKVFVTGCAGFIGSHVAEALLARGDSVIGVDSLNDYYDVRLKTARLDRLRERPGFQFHTIDISDKQAVGDLVAAHADIGELCTWQRRLGCGTRWWTPTLMCRQTCWGIW